MNKKIYSVRDCRLGVFAPPCLFENDSVAIRAFGDMVQKDDGLIGNHPEDFCLYCLGVIDLDKGIITTSEDGPISVAMASDFKYSEKKGE